MNNEDRMIQLSPQEAVKAKSVVLVMRDPNTLKTWVGLVGMTKAESVHSFEETVAMLPDVVAISSTHAVNRRYVALAGISPTTMKVGVVLITGQSAISDYDLATTVEKLNGPSDA